LAEQIHNNLNRLAMVDLGMKYTLTIECRLERRNIQFPGVLNLSIKS
jgi:hypothetical protein